MSGHSKWSTIKRKKGAADQARGRIFSRHARELMVAAREGGGDPAVNPRLRLAIQRAKADGVPNDTVERAIKKGCGELQAEALEECTYEAYGPHGVAIMIDCLTDNRNRTVGDIRAVFNRLGGSLGASGCVAFQFEKKGVVQLDLGDRDEDSVLEIVLDAGAEDMTVSGTNCEITCAPEHLSDLVQALTDAGLEPSDFQISRVPTSLVPLDRDQARQVLRLLDALEDLDDVERVSANFDIDDSVLEAIGAES